MSSLFGFWLSFKRKFFSLKAKNFLNHISLRAKKMLKQCFVNALLMAVILLLSVELGACDFKNYTKYPGVRTNQTGYLVSNSTMTSPSDLTCLFKCFQLVNCVVAVVTRNSNNGFFNCQLYSGYMGLYTTVSQIQDPNSVLYLRGRLIFLN